MRDRYVPSIPIIIYTHSIYNVNRTILKTLHNLYIYLHMFLNDISSCVSLAITARTRNGCNCNRTLLLITSRILLLLLLFLLFNLKTKKEAAQNDDYNGYRWIYSYIYYIQQSSVDPTMNFRFY